MQVRSEKRKENTLRGHDRDVIWDDRYSHGSCAPRHGYPKGRFDELQKGEPVTFVVIRSPEGIPEAKYIMSVDPVRALAGTYSAGSTMLFGVTYSRPSLLCFSSLTHARAVA